jgi:hypothetical protein
MFRFSATGSSTSNKLLASVFSPTWIALTTATNYNKVVIDAEECNFGPTFNQQQQGFLRQKAPSSLSTLLDCSSSATTRNRFNNNNTFEIKQQKQQRTRRSQALKQYVENNSSSNVSAVVVEPTTASPVSLIAEKKKKVIEARRDLKIALKELKSAAKKESIKKKPLDEQN